MGNQQKVAVISMPVHPFDYEHGYSFMENVVSDHGDEISPGDRIVLDFRDSDLTNTEYDFIRAIAEFIDANDEIEWSAFPRSKFTKYLVTICDTLVTILEDDDSIVALPKGDGMVSVFG